MFHIALRRATALVALLLPFAALRAAEAQGEGIQIESLQFFESADKTDNPDKVEKGSSFNKTTARYINCLMGFRNHRHNVSDQDVVLTLKYFKEDGSTFGKPVLNWKVPSTWETGNVWKGFGYAKPGLWTPGRYRVEVWFGDRLKAISGEFTIVDDRPEPQRRADKMAEAGDRFFEKEKWEEAAAEFTKALELNPELLDAWFSRGRCRINLGLNDGAIADFDKYLALNPASASAYNNRAYARECKGDHDGAIADYTKAIEQDASFAVAYGNRASSKRAKGDWDGVIADSTRAVELDAKLRQAYLDRAAAYEGKDRLADAIRDLTMAVALDPSAAWTYAERGRVRRQSGESGGAFADLTKAIELDPKYAWAYSERALLRRSTGDLDGSIEDLTKSVEIEPKNGWAFNLRGRIKHDRKDHDGAIADYSKAIEVDPDESLYLRNRASAREDKGDLEGAVEDLSKAIEKAPKDAAAVRSRARLNWRMESWSDALIDYRRLCEVAPEEEDGARIRIVILRTRLGERDAAVKELAAYRESRKPGKKDAWFAKKAAFVSAAIGEEEFLKAGLGEGRYANPDQKCEAWFLAGTRRLLEGDRRGAVERFALCLDAGRTYHADHAAALGALDASDPKTAEEFAGRARARASRSEHDLALADAARAIELAPKYALPLLLKGQSLRAKSDTAGALAEFTRAVEIDPACASAWLNRAWSHAAEKDYEGAVEDYTRCLAVRPYDADVVNSRGSARSHTSDYAGAAEDYTHVLELDSTYAWAYGNRAEVKTSLGDFDGAIADATKALELSRYASAMLARADARAAKGDAEGAFRDYKEALKMFRRFGSAHLSRGRLQQDRGATAGALFDLRTATAYDASLRDPAIARIWILRTSLGEGADADRELAEWIGKRKPVKPDDWPGKILLLLAGKLSEEEFLKASETKNPRQAAERKCAALYYAGMRRIVAGDKDGGLPLLKQCVELGVVSVEERLSAAAVLQPPAADGAPGDAPACAARGAEKSGRGDMPGAAADYTKAIELDPKNADHYASRGWARCSSGDFAGAAQDHARSIELNPGPDRFTARAWALEGAGDLPGAIADYTKAIELNPKSEYAYSARGWARHKAGETVASLQDLDKSLALAPDYADALGTRGWIRVAAGDKEGGVKDLQRAVELEPFARVTPYYSGLLRFLENRFEEAVEAWEQASWSEPAWKRELEPWLRKAREGAAAKRSSSGAVRGEEKMAAGDWDGAAAEFASAISGDPSLARAYRGRALVWRMKGNVDAAMADLAKAVELDPKDSWNHHSLGCAHLDARSLTDALLSYRKAVEANPEQEYSRARIWLARAALGETAAATRELKKYLKDRKADPAREWTGKLLAHLAGDLPEADLLKAAEAEAPKRSERLSDAYFYAGWKRMVEGNREGAKEFFRKCVEIASPADLARVSAAAALARIEKEK